MRVLWIVNNVQPEVAEHFGCRRGASGGWVSSMLRQLKTAAGLEIGVGMRSPVARLSSTVIGGIQYFAMPQLRGDRFDVSQATCEAVLCEFAPDLLHAEGSEMAYTRRFLETWKGRQLLSLQGVINGIEPYEYGRLRIGEMMASLHPSDTLAALAMVANKRLRFLPRLRHERQTIRMARNIMGRTQWDRAHAYAINPEAPYYPCSRILRSEFYSEKWQPADFERQTILIGNGRSARKGAHFVLEAVNILRREYPSVRLRIAGDVPGVTSRPSSIPAALKAALGYGAYLKRQVERKDLGRHVEFVGSLEAGQMAEAMRRSHVYVLSSLIENSPNTLGEAMAVGVPSVASFVGGVSSMATDEEDALFYRAEDPICLAYQIKRLFDDDELCLRLSKRARERAQATHDPQRNLKLLLDVYAAIMSDGRDSESEEG